jgi:hypothetical protein
MLAPAQAAADPPKADLAHALRQGGFTVYFRHAATDWSQADHVNQPGDWKSCDGARMRQLSDAGRDTARRVGKAIKALAIPVSEVLSSEYCRAAETATLLDVGPVTTTLDIMNLRAEAFVGGRATALSNFRRILAKAPPEGSNRVIAGHGNLSRAATGAYPGEGGAVIIKADPSAALGFRVLGMLDPADWTRLAAQ